MSNPASLWPLEPGQALTRWLISETQEFDYPGEARPMPDRVDYRFRNGFVDVGDLPCRQAWRNAQERDLGIDQIAFSRAHCPDDGDDIDFSTFRTTPTLIRRFLQTHILADQPGVANFELATCGLVQIWHGSATPIRFAPKTRNNAQTRIISLDLVEGPQTITLLLEELHERDTLCFLRLRLIDGPKLSQSWPHPEPWRIEQACEALNDCRPVFDSNALKSPGPSSLKPKLAELRRCDRGGLWKLNAPLIDRAIEAEPDQAGWLHWQLPGEITAGPFDLTLRLDVDTIRVERQTGAVQQKGHGRLDQTTLAARKAQSIEWMLETRSMDPSTAWLALSLQRHPEHAAAVIEKLLPTIEGLEDCSDFNLITLIPIWQHHREQLPPDLAERLRAAIAGFRYWLDQPGNDVMWFWSENHVLCFHTCQWLAANALPEVAAGDVVERLHRWFDAILADGLAEWNSAAYYPIDLLALFALRDFGADPQLAKRATELLDHIFVMMALHSCQGTPAGSQGRAYEKELLAGAAHELGPITAIAFGGPFTPGFDRAAALFARSDYEPPAITHALANPTGTIRASYKQGADQGGRLSLWKSKDCQLSSAGGLKPGSAGHQQHMIDLQFAHSPFARVWVNAAGDKKAFGNRRPSFLAGNAVIPALTQFGPSVFLIYQGASDLGINVYLGAGHIEVERQGPWLHLRAGEARASLWCSAPLHDIGDAIQQTDDREVAFILTLLEPVSEPVFNRPAMTLHWLDHSLGFHQPPEATKLPTWPMIGFDDEPLRTWRDHDGSR